MQNHLTNVFVAVGFVLLGGSPWVAVAFLAVWFLPFALLRVLDVRDWLAARGRGL